MLISIISIAAPALTTLGAAFLANDALRGPIREAWKIQHENKNITFHLTRDVAGRVFRKADSLYPLEEREWNLSEIDKKHKMRIDESNQKYHDKINDEVNKAFSRAFIGLSLVTTGGVMQTGLAIWFAFACV